jgi:hypothetical protein
MAWGGAMRGRSQRSSAARAALYAGASALAIAVAVPHAQAADLPLKAPPVVDNGEFRAFIEGGAVWTAGDPVRGFFPTLTAAAGFIGFYNGLTPGSFALRPRLGWEAATGFDYRFAASPWHVSAQFRYGEGRASAQSPAGAINLTGFYGLGSTIIGSQFATGEDRETHWLADFAVGRDVHIGANPLQVKAGIRIAELTSKLNIVTNGTVTLGGLPPNPFGINSLSYLYNVNNQQNTSFRGAGPRIGFEGAVPLGGGWQVDYLADVALLFGTRRLDQTLVSAVTSSPFLFGATATLAATGNEHGAVVPNLDAQLGLSYWLNPGLKLTASYRVDAYFGALTTYDPAGANQQTVDRIFHGPRLTLTGVLTPDPRIAPVAPAGLFKAPPPAPKGQFTAYVEGSAFWTGGDPIYTFYPGVLLNPGYFALKPKVGWDAAAGFDWRAPGSEWHISAAFNYGQARTSDSARTAITATIPVAVPPITFAEAQAADSNHRETHWTADFAVGRDIMLGADTVQVKGGVRVAELTARTSTQAPTSLNVSSPLPFTVIGGVPVTSFGYLLGYDNQQESKFRGAGPRLGIEGSVPLRGGFMLDFAADAAALFGTQWFKTVQVGTTTITTTPPVALPPVPPTVTVTDTSKNAVVYNADIQAGIGYWVTPNFKLSAAYRLDAFFGALRTLDAQANPTKVDRYFHGPRVAATVRF